MKKIIVLIDAENIHASFIGDVLSGIKKSWDIIQKKAYGDFTNPTFKEWEESALTYAIVPVQQFNYVSGKNMTDIALAIDAMELFYTYKPDAFCIVSSDSDFIPLILKLRSHGLTVLGAGKEKSSERLVKSCDKFAFLDQKIKAQDSSLEETEIDLPIFDEKEQQKLAEPFRGLIKKAIPKLKAKNNQVELDILGRYLKDHHNFNAREKELQSLTKLVEILGYKTQDLANGKKVLTLKKKAS
ncbi:MAG: hypothetical protein ACI86H_002749 [bacterium]